MSDYVVGDSPQVGCSYDHMMLVTQTGLKKIFFGNPRRRTTLLLFST